MRLTCGRAVQVNTGAVCHLDAPMVRRAIESLQPDPGSLLMIENVGNLVCPALFDVGEQAKVVIISVTEGDDKPLKYPHLFAAADLIVVNKTDLLPYVHFDPARLTRDARRLNPDVQVFARVRAHRGEPHPVAGLVDVALEQRPQQRWLPAERPPLDPGSLDFRSVPLADMSHV